MENKENNFALLVHACDRYELLYKGFQYFFKKYWDFKVPCAYYFATEEKKIELEHFVNICSGKGEWSDRLMRLLEKIPERYIIYFQEDMWLNKEVDGTFFREIFNLIKIRKWQQIKLHSSSVYTTKETDIYIKGFNVSTIDKNNSDFLMSHQITIWDKNFLISLLKPKEHPWRNERKATKRMKKMNAEIFHVDFFAENGHPAINKNLDSVFRSSYYSISINGTLNECAHQFIQILLEENNQNVKEYAQKLQYNLKHQLTHDGLRRPRKVDIFKRIKNWFQGK